MSDASPPFPPVQTLVPHGPPMLLLDEVYAFSTEEAACRCRIRDTHPLLRDGKLPAVIGLELMAQCTAVYLGMLTRRMAQTPGGGLLAGAPKLEVCIDAFEIDDTLDVRVARVWGQGRVWRFDGEVRRDGRCVVRGTLDVIRTPAHGDA